MLEPADIPRLANLCGPLNRHLRQLEKTLGVEINNQGNYFSVSGEYSVKAEAVRVLRELYDFTAREELTPNSIHLHLQSILSSQNRNRSAKTERHAVRTRQMMIYARGSSQESYLHDMRCSDLVFGVGPAGTGKTYLAVAVAVESLTKGEVDKLVLVRPAVEAGERLGFLPGDVVKKVDPYLKPMYDALYDTLGHAEVNRLIDRGEIEVAPLAYMRGRSLNTSFIILDEAQNTTIEQMKMFLTRIGFGSKAVVTGDTTQIDLPRDKQSGLEHAVRLLHEVEGVKVTFFSASDVVRHRLLRKIIHAYEKDAKDHES